jgi:DNA polymerase III subunit epsilon
VQILPALFLMIRMGQRFSFGKYKGKNVEKVFEEEPGYFGWIQNADFPLYTKKMLTAIKLRKLNTKIK